MSADIFSRARQLAGKRGNQARKRGKAGKLGGFTVSDADRGAFARVESPRYW